MRRSTGGVAMATALALVVLMWTGLLPMPSADGVAHASGVPTPTLVPAPQITIGPSASALNDDWPMYMQNIGRNSANPNETDLTVGGARNISLLWTNHIHGGIESSAVVVGGVVYLGTGTGNFSALNISNGTTRWSTYIGQSFGCNATGGVASTATVVGGHIYVAGGDSNFYALNATTGTIEWKVFIGNTSHGFYNWGSPLFAKGFIYYGTASRCDAPLVPAALLQIDPVAHRVLRVFNTTQGGALGASMWSSPTINLTSNTVYVTTGNSANIATNPPLIDQDSVIALNATTLQEKGMWTLPKAARFPDGDFGATPSLVSGGGHDLVIAINKNGILYAFNQSNVTRGPLWADQLSSGSQNGYNIATASFANGLIYQGAGNTNISGLPSLGSFYAIYPGNGTIKWAHAMSDHVFRAAAVANGLVVVEATKILTVLAAASGRALFHTTCNYPYQSDPTIAEGHLLVGCNGFINAYGLGLSSGGSAVPTTGPAPLQVAFSTTAHGGNPPYTYSWSFGDGTTALTPNLIHTFQAAGTFHPTIWVNDSHGNSSNRIFTITVTPGPPGSGPAKGGSFLGRYGTAIVAGAVALALLLILAVLYRRHRRRQAAAPPVPWSPPAPAVALPPAPSGGVGPAPPSRSPSTRLPPKS
jgi:polyvinyl alcohol dehydrogenase (cytochrome)